MKGRETHLSMDWLGVVVRYGFFDPMFFTINLYSLLHLSACVVIYLSTPNRQRNCNCPMKFEQANSVTFPLTNYQFIVLLVYIFCRGSSFYHSTHIFERGCPFY